MKAYEITTKDKYGKKYTHVFKHYENALGFKMRLRKIKLSKPIYNYAQMYGKIKTIEVANDYWKKDFGGGYSFSFTNDGLKGNGYHKHTESEYLYGILYGLRADLWTGDRGDQNNPVIKFVINDLSRYLNLNSVPKKERDTVARECLLSCWKMLRQVDKDYLIPEHTRGMYEDDFNEYCQRMESMQQEFNDFLVTK